MTTTFDGTTLARVRLALFKTAADSQHDGILALLITEASAMVEGYLNKPFLIEARTERYDVTDPRQKNLYLRSSPISTMTSVEYDGTGQFTGDESTLAATDYILNSNTGQMQFRGQPVTGFQAWKVVYTAGLAANTAALISAYPRIARAIDLQVTAMFHRIDDPQVDSRSLGGAAVKVSEPMGLIKAARNTCNVHRMIRFPL